MGEKTVLLRATTTSNLLRTTVPLDIVKQFGLKEGKKLNWEIRAENGKLVIIVKSME